LVFVEFFLFKFYPDELDFYHCTNTKQRRLKIKNEILKCPAVSNASNFTSISHVMIMSLWSLFWATSVEMGTQKE
jgi:hypothetical protein